jgi:hypothetical protein
MAAYLTTAALLRILELSHEALVTGVVITKRFLSCLILTFYIPTFEVHANICHPGTSTIAIRSSSSNKPLLTAVLMILHIPLEWNEML